MKNLSRYGFLTVSFLMLCSCASISTMQTAKTTDKGEFDHVFGFGSLKADVDAASGVKVESGDTTSSSISVPMAEYMVRYGITDAIDIGLRTTGFVHGVDGKWNFLKSGDFLMSTGLGLSYLSYTISDGTNDIDVTAIDIVPALYMDYVVQEKFRFYLVPKLVRRSVSITGQDNESINYLGGSIGFKWGITSGFFAEYTMLSGSYTPSGLTTERDVNLGQFSAGFFF